MGLETGSWRAEFVEHVAARIDRDDLTPEVEEDAGERARAAPTSATVPAGASASAHATASRR
ncbi:hypothetical protein [Mobilicoccus pelagius]|uniref:Uncharacterized protein n=1 Tax=Mobilicoccus pelagius NBRC 104925 TaxID=1089455 RepID=H5UVP6_9MICO|nr:hypothetical protein [Mobilicoccus pelagius]GAB49804.1 hypothetical protein MOPEL_135_00420 [Mobilicoccus pelagius NBRC 104925]